MLWYFINFFIIYVPFHIYRCRKHFKLFNFFQASLDLSSGKTLRCGHSWRPSTLHIDSVAGLHEVESVISPQGSRSTVFSEVRDQRAVGLAGGIKGGLGKAAQGCSIAPGWGVISSGFLGTGAGVRGTRTGKVWGLLSCSSHSLSTPVQRWAWQNGPSDGGLPPWGTQSPGQHGPDGDHHLNPACWLAQVCLCTCITFRTSSLREGPENHQPQTPWRAGRRWIPPGT